MAAMEEVRQLYDNGYAPDEIIRLTGHTFRKQERKFWR